MRVVAAALLAAIVLGACVSAQAVDTTDATFDEVIKSSEFVLMEFYAPWCGHCKKLEPEWNKAAEQLKDVAVLAKLDATKETVSAGKFGIQGYPTIKVFRDGVLSGDFQGGRTAPEIVKYVKANVGPAVRAIASADELTALKTEQNVAVVFFADALGGEAFEAFESVAKKLRGEFTFAAVSDSTLASAESVTSGSVVLFKQFDEKKVVFDGDAKSAEAIEDFVKGNGVPHFDEIGPHNYKMYVDRKLPMVWVFTTPSDEATKAAGQAAAPGYKGKMSFVWIDSSKYAGMAQRLGLAGDKFPAVAIDNNGKHYAMPEGDITADSLKAFADKFLSGELAATIRSEAEPAEHTVNGLTTITGKTFESLVSNADVDVFIEFYAPWCGHCKQLAPVYEEVAKELADEPIRVAKIDATANDFPQDTFAVQGFPTMFYVPKATRKPVQYEGGRTKDALLEFLKSKLA